MTAIKTRDLDCYASDRVFDGIRVKSDPVEAAAFVARAKRAAEAAKAAAAAGVPADRR